MENTGNARPRKTPVPSLQPLEGIVIREATESDCEGIIQLSKLSLGNGYKTDYIAGKFLGSLNGSPLGNFTAQSSQSIYLVKFSFSNWLGGIFVSFHHISNVESYLHVISHVQFVSAPPVGPLTICHNVNVHLVYIKRLFCWSFSQRQNCFIDFDTIWGFNCFQIEVENTTT